MRSGVCALQQALTADAAAIVNQAVLIATRRGHAQVTPLHVANTMLAAPGGSFRAACLESNSHPLQCKALELCFNVALNRIPVSSSNPMLGPHHHSQNPSISNALGAAFKRAQAHQRRGSVESAQQQQTLLAAKIELEQLIISILDDPSVSRVMREAGFSSTQVKSNVEKAVSLELRSNTSSPPNNSPNNNNNNRSRENSFHRAEGKIIKNEYMNIVVENLLLMSRKRKSLVLVGECVSSLESTIKALMDKVDKGEVPESLKEIKFITIPPLYSFCNLRRDEVELKIGELTRLVRSVLGKGVVLYLGDFKWISDYRVGLEEERRYYCSVEHVIVEIGRLVGGIGEIEKFWLMGIADFQTYMRCRNGSNNSLENVWGLHPVTIPANSLGFGLVSESEQIEARQRRAENPSPQLLLKNGDVKLSCCTDCSAKLEEEAKNLPNTVCNTNEPTLSILPSWLKDESRRLNNQNQNSEAVKELCKKWNSYCNSAHKHPSQLEKTLTLFSSSCFSFDRQNPDSTRTHCPLPDPNNYQPWMPNLSHMHEINGTFSSNSASSSEIMEMDFAQKFKEFNAENLNILSNALEKKFPCQKDIIPEIAGTILQCRSGMLRRKDQIRGNNNINDAKHETWLFFLGPDVAQAKEKISKELAKTVFGSYSNFVSIGLMSSFVLSSTPSDIDRRNKRVRDEENCKSYLERFAQAVSENPHRVFLLEDLEQVDYCSQRGIKRAIDSGNIIRNENGAEEFGFCDAIIVLSCESFKSRSSRACSSSKKQKTENATAGAGEEDKSRCVSLDLNLSFDGDADEDDLAVDELGVVFENVDRRVVFKTQDL